jgi:AraC family transcriptional regulator of adaptative response/methylated-DNA-[protein]-cysteine methyltransferase
MNDYERIAATIRFLDRRHTDQPDLAALARGAGLSPFHFHRLFSSWAGVTPKDFLQCLTLGHVKTLLRAGDSVLHAALEAGLSGPGRMHDLCVTLEAATPGELKSGGAGLKIAFAFVRSPFGEALIGETNRGLCHFSFIGDNGRDRALQDLRAEWPAAKFERAEGRLEKLTDTVFARDASTSSCRPLRAFVRGTPFQLRVWRALLRIPSGSLTTYGRLASAIGQAGASRSVGTALGANPIGFIIPCHRVIRETGILGDYRWDPVRKRAMIGWEISRGGAMADARAA